MGGIIDHMDKMDEQYRKDHTFAPAKPYDFNNPADQLRGGLLGPGYDSQKIMNDLLQRQQTPAPTPIKIFTVCVNSEIGGEKYMAFLGNDPSKKATASTRDQAIVDLLTEQKLIVAVEND
jgi:hypothetical protein